jgi:hypothetical protein
MQMSKYCCRPLPAVRKRKLVAKGTQVLPPVKNVRTLAQYNIPGAHFNPTELKLDAGLSETEWSNIGRAITHVESASKWWIGDWLRAGSKAYGKRATFDLARQATGNDKQVLWLYSHVASRFEPHRRVAALSFSHHTVVAALPPEVADRLLHEAVELGLTSDQLYKMGRDECGKKRTYTLEKLKVYLSDETLEILKELSQSSNNKRLGWYVAQIVEEWLRDRGHDLGQPKTKKELYAERQAAGFCGYCGENIPEAGKKTCEKCLATQRTYDRWSYHEKQELEGAEV